MESDVDSTYLLGLPSLVRSSHVATLGGPPTKSVKVTSGCSRLFQRAFGYSRKLASASWSLLALASSGAAPRHHVNIH